MIKLYPFQVTLIDRLRDSIRSGHRSPMIVAPTGSGKGVMLAWLTGEMASRGYRTNIVNHRAELSDQISVALKEFSVRHGMVSAENKYFNADSLTHVSSAFTLVRRLGKVVVPDYLFLDESHHCIKGSTWGKIFSYWRQRNPKLVTVGWTATPERLGGEGLDNVFDDLIVGPTTGELIKDGYLSPFKLFAPPQEQQPDFSRTHHRAGDFVRAETAGIMDKPTITGNAIVHYQKHLNGAPSVAFCVSVEHAHHTAELFKAAGHRAAAIDGKMPKKERKRMVKDFGRGQLNLLISCDLISEGFDVPGMAGAILLRPTESLALYLQQVGRTLRIAPNKEYACILDHVGNCFRHGMPDDAREWSLKGHAGRKTKRDPDDVAIRQCSKCGAVSRLSATHCRDCGFEFPIKVRKIQEVKGDLEEIKRVQAIKERKSAYTLEQLTELGRMRGYKNPAGWAFFVMRGRGRKTA